MEEIDDIIIESLKHLKCNIDDEVKSIKGFDADMVVDAVVSCLNVIIPGINMSHKLPPSMTLRLKLATTLSESIKGLGFRGDIGYQTILYCNEVEVRRVLMFLIERLPRDADEDIPVQHTGYVHNLTKKIQEKVKLSLEKSWIPTCFLHEGVRECRNDFLKSSYNSSHPLKLENIHIPSTRHHTSEVSKEFWIYCVKDVSKQCSSVNLIPSLLFHDCDFGNVNLTNIKENLSENNSFDINESVQINAAVSSTLHKIEENEAQGSPFYDIHENRIQILLRNIEHQKEHLLQLKEELKAEKIKYNKISDSKEKEQEYLKSALTKYKIKSRTLTVLSKEENLEKLQNLVQNGTERLIELEKQWKTVQAPLLAQYESLSSTTAAAEIKHQEERLRIKNIIEKRQQLLNELKNKDKMEKVIKQERERLNKNTRRSAYTRRILEIIGNIKKQNEEIEKILNDTKIVQKNINGLNGQLDRSFTLSDELIFRNAKQDEMSRRAYKLLATLHNDCGSIIQAITEIGITEREARNLQEQIDTEVTKATGVNLERVNADLQNMKKETALLLSQTHVQ